MRTALKFLHLPHSESAFLAAEVSMRPTQFPGITFRILASVPLYTSIITEDPGTGTASQSTGGIRKLTAAANGKSGQTGFGEACVKSFKHHCIEYQHKIPEGKIFNRNGQYPQSRVLGIVIPNDLFFYSRTGQYTVHNKERDKKYYVTNHKLNKILSENKRRNKHDKPAQSHTPECVKLAVIHYRDSEKKHADQ